ncbi:uncharacterized protein LOC143219188 [Lasioglossum baleicum]|uniref:uncharacterized protein LOC143219188 n=1 Tax=Lasioglossum baleicum TaxID=434251 RepID=UPI003FCE4A31
MWHRLIVLALFVHCGSAFSANREQQSPSVSSAIATEVEDLLGEGNAPKLKQKNASGKSAEGGYYKTYGSDAENEKGYMKETYSKGNHGYKTLDTFHKRDGDKYAFEKHVAYGKARSDKKSNHHGEDSGSSSQKGSDHEGADFST